MEIVRRISLFIRKICFSTKRRKIQTDVTIISNNCTGGVMYNDLGLRFNSPTINLCFGSKHDFYNYVKYLIEYTNKGVLFESTKKEEHPHFPKAPIGILKCDNLPDIELHFLHYPTFDDAKNKWIQRSKRINFNKIFLVIEAQNDYEKSMVPLYNSLPYKKVIFSDSSFDYACCLKMEFYSRYGTGVNCPILRLCNVFGKRGYDEYDFVNSIFKRTDWCCSSKGEEL